VVPVVNMRLSPTASLFPLTVFFFFFFSLSVRNGMPDYGSEVMAEALAQRALAKPVYAIPIIPASSGNQYRHQDHMDMKDYKKVRWQGQNVIAQHCLKGGRL